MEYDEPLPPRDLERIWTAPAITLQRRLRWLPACEEVTRIRGA